MTLNFCKRPIFSVSPYEEIFVSSCDDHCQPQFVTWDVENSFYGVDTNDREISWEPLANDILDLLPLDPFGMGISATFATMTGWMEDFEADRLSVSREKEVKFLEELLNMSMYEGSNPFGGSNGCVEKHGNEVGSGGLVSNGSDRFLDSSGDSEMGSVVCCDKNGSELHVAMPYSFRFLSVQDLLSLESVCRSFHSEVENDVLLWRNIHINHPLNERITDDALLKLTDKAQGHLQSLSLVDCFKITDDTLKCVLERNPRLTKLNVSGCTRLSLDGIITNLKAFKSSSTLGMKHLGIGERYGISQERFEELKSLIGTEACVRPKTNPRFYHSAHSHLSWDDDCALDIETCPRCKNVGLVYDCPAESCQGKQSGIQSCRACTICIPRCIECGRCINDTEYEETFLFDLLCVNC